MSDVETWADAFGLWHASVPITGNDAADRKRAVDAIRRALEVRGNAGHAEYYAASIRRECVKNYGVAVYGETLSEDADL